MDDSQISPTPENPRKQFSYLMRLHHREPLLFAATATQDQDAAKDIVQESFVSAWRKFDTFDPNRDFGAWMRGIVRNKTKDWFRKIQRQPLADEQCIDLEVEISDWQSAREKGHSIFELVDDCINKLPSHFKAAVRTFYLEERTGEEAADLLDVSPDNLRKRLQRAR